MYSYHSTSLRWPRAQSLSLFLALLCTAPIGSYGETPRGAFDLCSIQAPCAFGLLCSNMDGKFCGRLDVPCVCLSATPTQCISSTDCGAAEACIRRTITAELMCASCDAVRREALQTPIDALHRCYEMTAPVPPVPWYALSDNGLTYDRCVSPLECSGTRDCRSRFESAPCPSGSDSTLCHCVPPEQRVCVNDDKCEQGERCILHENTSRICVSARVAMVMDRELPTNSPSPSPVLSSPEDSAGLSDMPCRFDWHCQGARRCTHRAENFGGCAGRRACFCELVARPPCVAHADCESGEVCANYLDARTRAYCSARDSLGDDPAFVRVDERVAAEDVVPNGLTSEVCRFDKDCRGTRLCHHRSEWMHTDCAGRRACACRASNTTDPSCDATNACSDGELCYQILDAIGVNATCAAPSFLANPAFKNFKVIGDGGEEAGSDSLPSRDARTDDASCIDVALLQSLDASELVFASSRRAAVLCDAQGSCATAGHMVVWRGTAMSMRTYCASAPCVRRVRLVNSPRMARGRRVEARTQGLQFTALAARFETALEEGVLATLVHAGF